MISRASRYNDSARKKIFVGTVRDTYFDAFKGMMILSVINIHTVYWSLKPYTPDIARQLAYFVDIPIFFFISGYFARHTTFLESARQALHQLGRLYLRYLVIAILVAIGVLAWVYFALDRIPEGLQESLVSIFTLKLSGELWGYFKGFYGNLWYLHTYFPMLLIIPFVIGTPLFPKFRYLILIILFALYWLMTYQIKGHVFLLRAWGDILFYCFIFVLGTVYRLSEQKLTTRYILLSLCINIGVAFLVFLSDDAELRLSAYKFPPAIQWLIYSLLLVHIFMLVRPYWSNYLRPLLQWIAPGLEWIGTNSFTVYLIQGLVCSIPFLFASRLAESVSSVILLYLMVFGFNVVVSILLSKLYLGCEHAIVKTLFRRRVGRSKI